VGDKNDPKVQGMLNHIHALYLSNNTIQLVEPGKPLDEISPLLQGKGQVDGRPTVYLCRNFTCSQPVTEWEDLKKLLEE
jgi:uncharacterized protein YyaL (SSP411 family)